MSVLADYVLEVATNPEALAEFTADPERASRTRGLSESARKALISRSIRDLHSAIAIDTDDTELNATTVTVIVLVT